MPEKAKAAEVASKADDKTLGCKHSYSTPPFRLDADPSNVQAMFIEFMSAL